MTSDGILQDDWRIVDELAERVVLFTEQDRVTEMMKAKNEMLHVLNGLEAKYGARPSILATRSDYIDDLDFRLKLLQRAYDLAYENSDAANCTFISSSLAQSYIEEANDAQKGKQWLRVLRSSLNEYWDQDEYNVFIRLQSITKSCW